MGVEHRGQVRASTSSARRSSFAQGRRRGRMDGEASSGREALGDGAVSGPDVSTRTEPEAGGSGRSFLKRERFANTPWYLRRFVKGAGMRAASLRRKGNGSSTISVFPVGVGQGRWRR